MNSNDFFSMFDVKQYEFALCEVNDFLTKMLDEFCDFESIGYMSCRRIKSIASIDDKLHRKGYSFDNVNEKIFDIAGIRIVFCNPGDLCDLNLLDNYIHSWNKNDFILNFFDASTKYNGYIKIIYDFIIFFNENCKFKVLFEKDYILNPKQKGYQSYHMVLMASNGAPVEIQFRNLLQHFFAEFEHDNRYKADVSVVKEYDFMFDMCAEVLFNESCSFDIGKNHQLRLSL